MELRSRIVAVTIAVVSLLVFSLFFGLFLVSSLYYVNNEIYLETEFDPSSNLTSSHFVNIGRNLGKDEFASFFTTSGKFVLITPLGSLDYGCTGSCYCLDGGNNKGRRNVGVAKNSLYFALTASSVFIAMYYSKQFFHDSCERRYSHMCSDIKSEVDECVPSPFVELNENSVDNQSMDKTPFQCIGMCSGIEDFERLLTDSTKIFGKKPPKGIKKIKRDAKNVIKSVEESELAEFAKELDCESQFEQGTIQASELGEAIVRFREDSLSPFCKEVGSFEKFGYDSKTDYTSLCFADTASIDCRPIF